MRGAMLFAQYSPASFVYPFFMPGSDKALVIFIGVLPSGFTMSCYILDAQFLHQPQHVPHVEENLCYENPFFGFITYFTKTIVSLQLYRSHDIQGVTQSLTQVCVKGGYPAR